VTPVPTYGRGCTFTLEEDVACALYDGPGVVPVGAYRVQTFHGRTERALQGSPVFTDVWLHRADGASYRVPVATLQALLQVASRSRG